jgi:Co/Zn/Cd efflux system component
VLIGLGLNSLFGWSWADPIAALVIAAVAVKEGRDAWRGDICCAPRSGATTSDANDGCADGCCTPPEPADTPSR